MHKLNILITIQKQFHLPGASHFFGPLSFPKISIIIEWSSNKYLYTRIARINNTEKCIKPYNNHYVKKRASKIFQDLANLKQRINWLYTGTCLLQTLQQCYRGKSNWHQSFQAGHRTVPGKWLYTNTEWTLRCTLSGCFKLINRLLINPCKEEHYSK